MLPQLKPTNGSTAAVQSAARSRPALRGVVKSIDSIAARIDRLDTSDEVDLCKKLLNELRDAVKACEESQADKAKVKSDNTEEKSPERFATTA